MRDLLRVGSLGLRSRRLRAALSALGVAIGIAAVVAVLGISASSRADLIAQLDALGTNLLRVSPGQTLAGDSAELPAASAGMIGRIGDTEQVSASGSVNATVRRTDRIPVDETGGLTVKTADSRLLATLGATMRRGRFLDAATAKYPTVVLGSVAASRLGIDEVNPAPTVWIGNRWFTVIGILDSVPLAPEIDRAVLIGPSIAAAKLGWDRSPSTVYVRANPDHVEAVRDLIPATGNPQDPEEVQVNRPSDALAARAAAKTALTALFLGLGAVALLVGGVGIANVMVISVLERRGEVGLRRALGATRRDVGMQFLTESLLLSLLGGALGVIIGAAITYGYATSRSWRIAIPVGSLAGGLGAALVVGTIAGLYPALRAARLAPTEALRAV
jgi:putative ABC transport system permease protein